MTAPDQEPDRGASSNLPKPKFRLQIHDLRHPASQYFLTLIPDLASTLETALEAIIQNLYTPPPLLPSPNNNTNTKHTPNPPPTFTPWFPPTRSVTVLLRDIGGVAYTTGTELDNDHKEIHISLSYIDKHCRSKSDPLAELVGVITHELVHCYQYAAPRVPSTAAEKEIPQAPGGLVEGVADFVRLKAGLDPPHWNRPSSAKERGGKWDQGYQHTAYFLAWLEDVWIGKGAVGMLNDRLARVGYVGEEKPRDDDEDDGKEDGQGVGGGKKGGFWKGLYGAGIDELWEEYGKYLDGKSVGNGTGKRGL
ncbi:hypothetical protein ARAM_004037 [Aspergillus rambellii]|uniref:PBSP domain protein n=1 Tax=Aspergillus rambellii TaxID=308745 RepID=A0A0F8ULU0_9EURO|nr:hypothetical protein ARAM_004037 [Aspergillus rambellii]